MKKRAGYGLILTVALVLIAFSALAADVFRFTEKSINLFEGETAQVQLQMEGAPGEGGTLTYSSANAKTAKVDADGTITALKKGQTTVKATLKAEKKSWSATVTVNVIRRVTNVTLNTTRLQVYRPTDVLLQGLLREETENDVILLPAGRSFDLRSTVTPSDANSKKVVYESSDEGVLKISQGTAKAAQAGECDLTIYSAQNPEIMEQYHVLVTQPVTKLTLSSSAGKTVNVGESTTLKAAVEPANASIQSVEWTSKNPQVATVDENGVVTPVKRGTVTIEAKAVDGSGKTASIGLTIAQGVTRITFQEDGLNLATGQTGYLHAVALPTNANEKAIAWSSSDPGIATVSSGGQVKGIKRGECYITATSKSNPEISNSIKVQVIQRVTQITFPGGPVSLPIQSAVQLSWQVLPEDASIQEVTFSSSNPKVATVDGNGFVRGITRGSANITATATDGSNRRGQVRVTVTQPVEGVSIQYQVYHVQLERSLNAKAIIQPSNANNQNVHFTVDDEYIASVSDSKNIGRLRGLHSGVTTLRGVTEDGGYSAQAEVRVADFNRAIVVDDLYMEGDNIRISLRNRSDFTVDRVYFTIETFDQDGNPLVCNSDGVSNSFQGSYRLELGPDERSEHYRFEFGDYVQPTTSISTVSIYVTGWRDLEGYTRSIPEDSYPSQSYHRFVPKPVQTEP